MFDPVGHFLVFGTTYTGKTYYTKRLLTEQSLKPSRIVVFTSTPDQWAGGQYEVYSSDYEENAQRVWDECKAAYAIIKQRRGPEHNFCEFVIVYDDFNDQINTHKNDLYNGLFTAGRHSGIRVINLAHETKAIGPVARANCRYVCIMAATPLQSMESLAKIFMGGEKMLLNRRASEATQTHGQYAVVIIDALRKTITPHSAAAIPVPEPVQQHMPVAIPRRMPAPNQPNNIVVERDVELPTNAMLRQDPANAIYPGVAPIMTPSMMAPTNTSMGNKFAQNMVDNSTNNFQVNHNIKMTQMVEQNNINNKIKLQNLQFDMRVQQYQDACLIKELIRKPLRTPEETRRILAEVNTRLRPDIPYTTEDLHEGMEVYMLEIHGEKLNIKDKKHSEKLIDQAASLVYSGGDPWAVFTAGRSMLSDANSMWRTQQDEEREQIQRIRNRKAAEYKKETDQRKRIEAQKRYY
jgi:hypothetical protein